MTDTQRAALLALYAAAVATLAVVDHASPLYRALCQVRAELERALGLSQTPTRRAIR